MDGADQRDGYFSGQRHQDPYLFPYSGLDHGLGGAGHLHQLHFGNAAGRGHQSQGRAAEEAVAHPVHHFHRHSPVRQPSADLPGIGAAGSRQRGADGAGLDRLSPALFAGSHAGARLRRGHQYVDRHPLHHDDLQRRSDEYPLRPVRKRRNRRCGAGAQICQHHAALYDLRHRARHHYHLCGQYQQLQRHLSADGRRALRAGLLSGGQDRPAGHVAV